MAAPLAASEIPADTLQLTVTEAIELLDEGSPRIAAARQRALGADAALRQAHALSNPFLMAEAENLGALEATSGVGGPRGVQGTLAVSLPVELGGARARGREVARADARLEQGTLDRVRIEEAVALLRASVLLLQREAELAAASADLEAIEELHRTLEAQAREGRGSAGAAARARLEATRARVQVARREAEVARAGAAVTIRLGAEPGVRIELVFPGSCPGGPSARESQEALPPVSDFPGSTQVHLLQHRAESMRAREDQTRASRLPTLSPLVGWRREAGVSGLVLGMGLQLPLLDRRSGDVAEARARARAADQELRAGRLEWEGARLAQKATITSLEASAPAFDASWRESLDLTVRAAEAAFREGEGTLEEVLQGRRARLEALESLAAWEASLRDARLGLVELEGRMPDEGTLCTPYLGEGER